MRRVLCLGLCGLVVSGISCRPKPHSTDTGGSDGDMVVVAKLVVRPGSRGVTDQKSHSLEDFIDAQRRILDSDEIRSAARVKAASAVSGTPPSIAIHVAARDPKSRDIISIIAHSASADYARAYSEALIEAFIEKVHGIRTDADAPVQAAGNSPELTAAELALKNAEQAHSFFKLEHDASQLRSVADAQKRRLKRLAVADSFYTSELDVMSHSDVEADIARRKFPPSAPPEMPDEFVRVLGLALTPNEQAYLNALAKADSAAIAATKSRAQKDHAARIESHKHQLAAVKELAADARKRLGELEQQSEEGRKLDAVLAAARATYDRISNAETQTGVDALMKSGGPQVVVSVIQKPELVNAQP